TFDRYQASSVVTYIFTAAGHHVLKAGVNVEYTVLDHIKATNGGPQVQESSDGTEFQDPTPFGHILGPDPVVFRDRRHVTTKSVIAGGFLQDSWEVLDQVTVNVGVRYDAQFLYGGDGQLGLALPNEWSPRLGVIYDATHTGRSKIYANYARYYEA